MSTFLARVAIFSAAGATLFGAPAFSCDDPPYHYKEKCEAYVPRSSAYAAVISKYDLLSKFGVKFELRLTDEKQLRELIGRAHLVQLPAIMALEQALVKTDFRIIATPVARATANIWVKQGSSIKAFADLKGKTVAIGPSEA